MPAISANPYDLRAAFDPAASVFVAANAGAGKTRLLTNRVLRLLLHGVPPANILCLTFTNAAAAEMDNRILKELGDWVVSDTEKLTRNLEELLSHTPDERMLTRARSLFAHVLEAPEGVRIQTIHGFCQSLLKRFPIEAGTSAHFTVIDERTEQELLQEARLRLFNHASRGEALLQEALAGLARRVGESGFQDLLGEIIQHKRRFRSLFHQPDGATAAIATLWRTIGLKQDTTLAALIEKHFAYDDTQLTSLRQIAALLLQGGIKDCKRGQALSAWCDATERAPLIADYLSAFLTKEGEGLKSLSNKGTLPDALVELLTAEQGRALRFHEAHKKYNLARHTAFLLIIAESLLAIYAALKRSRALMDYDDLILSACDLLQQPGIAPWVLFKLDGGIDHILVDEAQDTSPEQWQIIDALTQDFFSGESRKDTERSLFVVGDEKQSIYSFQGADPTALGHMQRYFSERINDAALPVHTIDLTHSFRSTTEVLSAVDAVFASSEARAGLTYSGNAFTHIATRLDQPGLVELWPIIRTTEEDTLSATTLLARHLAATIGGWLDQGIMLDAKNRPLEPGDIMILVRSRTTLVDKLVRALKRRNIPVAGADRMALGDNLAVKDLLAFGQCMLLPEDDLTLAALLKSPICGIDEDDLFALAWQREKASLWERLRQSDRPACAEAYALLSELRARTDFLTPYELYTHLLDTLGARRRITGRMGEEYNDPIDEFLNQTLLYERSHTASLQGFLHWLTASESQIKRDMEQSRNAVRIMTVHGAKGLQAPVVILPDTTETPKLKDMLLWHEQLPLWPGAARHDDALSRARRSDVRQHMLAEYRRLLYVALTRAEDRLYICGASGKESLDEQSWYHLVKTGLAVLATPFEHEKGEGLRVGAHTSPYNGKRGEQPHLAISQKNTDFLHRPPPVEPLPPQPLIPSHQADDAPASISPLGDGSIYQRGNLIHKLLQHLPGIAEADRATMASTITAMYRQDLSDDVVAQALREVTTIIDSPEFSFLFTDDALAEVPLTGCVEMRGNIVTVSGQIDRLKITERAIWIVDFKSNRLPPSDPADMPVAYINQLRLYRLLLQQIYPQKQVHCALLWTSNAKMTVIEDALLD